MAQAKGSGQLQVGGWLVSALRTVLCALFTLLTQPLLLGGVLVLSCVSLCECSGYRTLARADFMHYSGMFSLGASS